MEVVLTCADVIVTTPIQVANGGLREVSVDLITVDEATTAAEPAILAAWLDEDADGIARFTPLLLIGDLFQLGVPSFATKLQSKFRHLRSHSLFGRLSEILPRAMLTKMMRMTRGLQLLCSDLFYYQAKLQPGPETSIDHPKRKISVELKKFFKAKHPALLSELEDSMYPVHLDVRARCDMEENRTSRFNKGNVAVTLDLIAEVIEKGLISPDQVGIVTPYNSQLRLYEHAIRERNMSLLIEVGTTEYFQGRGKDFIVGDLVRSDRDKGQVGFLSDKHRLNTMLSRQKMYLIVVGEGSISGERYFGTILDRTER